MQERIKSIVIPNKIYSYKEEGKSDKVLDNLSKINIIVGENNSGKSRFLRELMNNKEMKFKTNSDKVDKLNSCMRDLRDKLRSFLEEKRLTNSSVETALNKIIHSDEIEFLQTQKNYTAELENLKAYIESALNSQNTTVGSYDYSQIGKFLLNIFQESVKLLEKPLGEFQVNYQFHRIYIPILRGLRDLSGNGEDWYEQRTLNDYGIDKGIVQVFTGLNIAREIRKHKLGEYKEQKIVHEFENYLSKNFFDGEEINLVPAETGSLLRIKIGKEKQFKIHELGDGIQSIIILTFQLFLNKAKISLYLSKNLNS